jgi:UDP-glucose 4-epimerase
MALYLVTGGAGFIGSNIVEELIKRGEKVRVLDNFSTGKRDNLSAWAGQIEGDIRSYHLVREAVEGVDFVLHQAALPSVPRSVKDPITSNEVNVSGTLNVLTAARDAGVKRVVYASSSSIYGDLETLPKTEDMLPKPLSPYAVSKLVLSCVFTALRTEDDLPEVFQRVRAAAGPQLAVRGCDSAVHPVDQSRRGACRVRGWRAIAGLHLCGQCRARELAGVRGSRGRVFRGDVQYRVRKTGDGQ